MHLGMNWNDLFAFLTVARDGRLTGAAKRLGIDHSTLSRRIIGLEDALRAKLFDRRAGGYTLTVEGERLLPQAEAVESLIIGIRARMDDPALGVAGSVRIGTPEGFGTYFLAPRINALAARHPDLEIELVANPRVVSVSKREADLAVRMSRPETGRLHARKLTDYDLGLYASRDYLARNAPIGDLDDLTSHSFVGYIDDLISTPELDYLSQVSRSIRPNVKISNIITQMTATVGGAGLCILPCFMVRDQPELVRLLPETVKVVRSYWLVTHSDMRDLARIKVASAFITDAVQAAPPTFWRQEETLAN